MRCCRLLWLLLLLAGALATSAQTFDLDQFDQLFRPRLRLEGRWLPEVQADNAPGTYGDRSALAVMTFPIHSTFKVNAQLDLKAEDIGELLRNSVRVRASQVMGNLRYGTRAVGVDEVLQRTRTLHTASIGALGISLTKKYRILFWSVNVNVSEEDRTFDRAVPRFGGVIGKMRVKGLKRQFFYGLAASYTDGLTLPVPFIGGTAPLGGSWSFNYVLPLQFTFACKLKSTTRFDLGAGLEGARSGIEVGTERYNLNYGGLRVFAGARHRFNKHFALRGELGYMVRHRAAIATDGVDDLIPAFRLEPGVQAMVGVNVYFGENVLDRILDEVLK